MNGYIVGPMPFHQAEALLAQLIYRSDSFHYGSNPVMGRLKTSFGNGNIIGVISFDNKVYTRIDYDEVKGFHFHFNDDNTGDKICILIQDMNSKQYQKYVRQLTCGRNVERRKKRKLPKKAEEEMFDLLLEEVEEIPPSIYYDLLPQDTTVEREEIAPQKKKRR